MAWSLITVTPISLSTRYPAEVERAAVVSEVNIERKVMVQLGFPTESDRRGAN